MGTGTNTPTNQGAMTNDLILRPLSSYQGSHQNEKNVLLKRNEKFFCEIIRFDDPT